jgi:hypothetical protein
MSHRILLGLFFCLGLTAAGISDTRYWKGIVEKHGPIPEAILEPEMSFEREYRELYPLSEQILTMLGLRRRARKGSIIKNCFSNQRVILGAIEMYNMDTNTMYYTLNPSDLADASSPLIKGGYLRSPIINADAKCVMRSYGNLAEEGVIYCEYHGATSDIQDELRALVGYKSKASSRERIGLLIILIVVMCSAMLLLVFRFFNSSGRTKRNVR